MVVHDQGKSSARTAQFRIDPKHFAGRARVDVGPAAVGRATRHSSRPAPRRVRSASNSANASVAAANPIAAVTMTTLP